MVSHYSPFLVMSLINQDTTFNKPTNIPVYFLSVFRVSHQQRIHLLWCNVLPSKLHDHTWEPLLKNQGENTNSKHMYPPEVSRSPRKMMALLSFWDGKFSEAMLLLLGAITVYTVNADFGDSPLQVDSGGFKHNKDPCRKILARMLKRLNVK